MRTTIRSAGNKRPGRVLPMLYYYGVWALGSRRRLTALTLAKRRLSCSLHSSFGALQDVF